MSKAGHHIRIEPPAGWRAVNVRELWRYRELLGFLVWRDVKVRYKQAVLGVAWAVLQPAMMMLVFTFLGELGGFSTGDAPRPLFVLSGLVAWTFFAAAVGNAAGSVVGSERLITKIYFPRLAVPFAAVGAATVDFAVALGLLAAVMAYYGVVPGWYLLAAPLAFAVLALAAAGLGTLLAALTVAYRDFRYLTPFLIQMGLYSTPTIFMEPAANAPEGLRAWLGLNPLVAPIQTFRAGLLGGPVPWEALGVSAALAAGLFAAGCLYFRRVEDDFADRI